MRFAYIPLGFGGSSVPLVCDIPSGIEPLKGIGDALERIFAGCNHGSGQEFSEFLGARMRSMSVGDLVTLEGLGTWRCESMGWEKI
jgi:hypothetical protein